MTISECKGRKSITELTFDDETGEIWVLWKRFNGSSHENMEKGRSVLDDRFIWLNYYPAMWYTISLYFDALTDEFIEKWKGHLRWDAVLMSVSDERAVEIKMRGWV